MPQSTVHANQESSVECEVRPKNRRGVLEENESLQAVWARIWFLSTLKAESSFPKAVGWERKSQWL